MERSARNAAVAGAGLAVALGTLAIDHLVGTESEPGEEGLADPAAFAIGAGIVLVLTGLLFGIVVRRAAAREPQDVALKAAAYAVLAILTIPLLFLAVPFPLAAAALALGLTAREGERKLLPAAAAAVGALVMVFGAAVYLVALVA